ncbi:MAG TPA: HEAT repeat domain-containing protein [Thermoleophilaceae bacterium]|nr:HEAT repeat domain-containing protein [Thermoleophilaceae bacterium]
MLRVPRARSLEEQLRSGTDAKRAEAALTLAEDDSPATVSTLTGALGDPATEVRAAAGLALASMRDPASISALAEIVAGWADPDLARCRHAALRSLAAFRGQEAAVALARALATAQPDRPLGLQEHSALLAVAYAEPAGAAAPLVVRALVALLAHEEGPVAERAASLLTLFPSESQGPLARALRSATAPAVRRRAATALGACRQGAAVEALLAALEDPAAQVRAAAARSLGDMRDPAAAGALEAAGGDGDETVRQAARSALRKLGTVASAANLAASFGVLAQRSSG